MTEIGCKVCGQCSVLKFLPWKTADWLAGQTWLITLIYTLLIWMKKQTGKSLVFSWFVGGPCTPDTCRVAHRHLQDLGAEKNSKPIPPCDISTPLLPVKDVESRSQGTCQPVLGQQPGHNKKCCHQHPMQCKHWLDVEHYCCLLMKSHPHKWSHSTLYS